MKRKRTPRISAALRAAACVLFAAALLARPETGAAGVARGLRACYDVVIPSLFPFLFLTDALRASLADGSRALETLAAILLGFVGGFPVGARGIAQCKKSGALSDADAAALLAGSVNAGPAFLITGAGLKLFGEASAGALLFCALSLASAATLLAALLTSKAARAWCASKRTAEYKAGTTRAQKTQAAADAESSSPTDERQAQTVKNARVLNAHKSESADGVNETSSRLSTEREAMTEREPNKRARFSLSDSLAFAVRSTTSLCGFVTFFSCVNAYLDAALAACGADELARALCLSALEVTGGCAAAAGIAGTGGLYLACAAVSVCGGCVLAQVCGICREAGVSTGLFFAFRPLHLALSHIFLRLSLSLFPDAIQASLTLSGGARAFSRSAASALALFALCVAFLLCERRFHMFTNR